MQQTDVDRRHFLNRATLGALAVFAAALGGGTAAFLWPDERRPQTRVVAGKRTNLARQIETEGAPVYNPEGKFYVIRYDGAHAYEYERMGTLAGGLMAISQRCTHLGCRVPFCPSSGWFECPCHGQRFDGNGERLEGPAPVGMRRHPIEVDARGDVIVDRSRTVDAVEGLSFAKPRGEFCVEG